MDESSDWVTVKHGCRGFGDSCHPRGHKWPQWVFSIKISGRENRALLGILCLFAFGHFLVLVLWMQLSHYRDCWPGHLQSLGPQWQNMETPKPEWMGGGSQAEELACSSSPRIVSASISLDGYPPGSSARNGGPARVHAWPHLGHHPTGYTPTPVSTTVMHLLQSMNVHWSIIINQS